MEYIMLLQEEYPTDRQITELERKYKERGYTLTKPHKINSIKVVRAKRTWTYWLIEVRKEM